MKKFVAVFALSTLAFYYSHSQVSPTTSGTDTMHLVEILRTNRYGYERLDSLTALQILVGQVHLKEKNTHFYADSTVINNNARIIEAFGNVHINDNDSVHTYSQYLLYNLNTKIAILKKKVRLTDDKTNLYTEELEYDVNQKIGIYRNGGRVVNGTSVLTSNEGTYYADLKDVYFKQNVVLKDPQYDLKSDSLLYNTDTEIATFISETFIIDSAKRSIKTREGYYDLKNKKAFFGRRPTIKDGAVRIIADEVETDDNTGVNKLRGNAVFVDTAQGLSVLANYIESNRDQGWFRATQHPLMIIKQENDSIYITADTLFSGRLSNLPRDSAASKDTAIKASKDSIKTATVLATKNDSTDRYFHGYHHVRIFSDSLQAVSDSLFYSAKDSIFKLFTDPIVWASGSQVTGDTIYLYTKNKKADQLYVFENGLTINKTGEGMFNQIRGNRLFGYFIDGAIDYMRAKGNAESVYYVRDDDELLVGINKATGDIIDMRFKNKELNRVVFISDVKGTMFPVNQMPEDEKTLRNFQWQDDKRPKTKFELFGN
ncbi:MAG TPA: OstA-like protein [Flavitalea sp.]|nr:OstA-like protein [Flavitalea sp.]